MPDAPDPSTAGAIEALPVLAGIEAIPVFLENDERSHRAIGPVRERYLDAGSDVFACEATPATSTMPLKIRAQQPRFLKRLEELGVSYRLIEKHANGNA